eukprot:2166527-Alexandrium_andersonii.AAC.1
MDYRLLPASAPERIAELRITLGAVEMCIRPGLEQGVSGQGPQFGHRPLDSNKCKAALRAVCS